MKRVKVAELIEGNEEYDVGKYQELLLRSGEALLAPFGYDCDTLRSLMAEKRQRVITCN
jgi:hypothetical protein